MDITQKRLETVLDENQAREQDGFKKGYSTVYHLQTINQLIEKNVMNSIDLFASDAITVRKNKTKQKKKPPHLTP